MTDFVHLHVHSDFSLQDAAVSVMSLADKAEQLGMKRLALTDHGNMFGAMEFLAACEETVNSKGQHEKRENPVEPIIGCEVYVSPGSRFEKKGSESDNKYYHLILLASNRKGYLNLVKLCSFAYTEGFYYRPRVDEELLREYREGLIALSACASGEIPRLIQAGRLEDAEAKARQYRDLFGKDEKGNPNFYLEIQDHGIPAGGLRGSSLSQRDISKALAEISGKTGIPLVATNDVHYLNREDAAAHDVLLCIGTGKLRAEEKRKKYYGDQFYFKTGDEMAALFPEYPEAIANTVRIAGRCVCDVPRVNIKDLPRYLPEFKIPPGFAGADAYLRHLTMEGLAKRYPREKAAAASGAAPEAGAEEGLWNWEDIQKRAEYELETIIQMGFTGYFLIVEDFINWAKEHGIPVGKGRGSGAGSIVAYSLRITDIDPLKYKLVFERFLTIERISMPDFDIDFANEGREEVIRYVIEKYGRDQVGQIITFGTLGAKAVIKDVARTLGISIPESEMISKLIPKDPKINLEKAFAAEPRLRELEQDPRYTELFSLARKLEGLHRHSSIHAAGVVIGKSALHNFVPLFKDPKTGGIATQYSMNFLETCGLVKMDFLGLKTLDVIKRTEELIRGRGGEYRDFNIENISESGTPESEAVFKMLSEGKSFEIFQFESEGMQNILKQAKPGRLEDLIALNALYRPGPMDSIPQFIESKNGQRAIEYPAAGLEPILKETYGVITYQEQVMQVAQVLAGYTLGQADLLRRAMGKKKQEVMDKEKERFIEGAVKQGYQPETAGKVFDLLAPFAGYGFNKCHAAAYSVLAYQTAYLKANFPAEFMAANLSNEIHSADKDKLSECIDEARKMGLAIDPPDINRSGKLFTVAEGRIIYGFLGIKGLGDGPAEEIVKGRAEGPYRDFMDFLQRADIKAVGKKVVELLIQTGAFDSLSPGPGRAPEQGLGQNRGILLGNLEKAADYVRNIKDEKKFGQASLFGETGEKEYPDFVFEPFPGTTREEMLRLEKELIGFYFSGHPMDEYREIWQKMVKADLGKPEKLRTGNCILVGIIKSLKTIVTGRGDKMAFATLADYRGEIEVTFFARAWEKCGDRVEPDKVAILRGKIEYQKDKDHYSFIAEEWINASEADEAAKEEEARERKWDKFRNIWMYAADLKSGDLGKAAKGNYTAVGLLKSLREFKDKKGNGMAFGTLQDYEGEIPLVFFARVWAECRDLLTPDEMVALKGSIDPAGDRNPEKPGFKVTSLADMAALGRLAAKRLAAEGPPDEGGEEARKNPEGAQNGPPAENKAPETLFREIHIRLGRDAADEDAALYPLHDCLVDNPGPCSVFIHVPLTGGETVIRTASQINASAAAISIDALKQCAGVAEVWGV